MQVHFTELFIIKNIIVFKAIFVLKFLLEELILVITNMNLEERENIIQNIELKHLKIKNYKCFGEHTIVGPFH